MKITVHKGRPRHIVIDDFLSPDELAAVHREFVALEPHVSAGQVLRDNNAIKADIKKRNRNVWLDDHYRGRRKDSATLNAFEKNFWSAEVKEAMGRMDDLLFEYALHCNADCTLLSAYGPGDFYAEHHDEYPSIACNLMVCTQPRRFKGGAFMLGDDTPFTGGGRPNYTEVEFVPGRAVIFATRSMHYVSAVEAPPDLPFADWRFTAQYWTQYTTARV